MTVTIYGAACSSTRKAKQWFSKHGVKYVERNIIKDPLTVSELQGILRMTVDGTDEIISTRSKIYKDLNLDIETLPLQELLELIHEHPRLLRSPIMVDEKRLQVGYHEEDIRQFLPRKTREYQWLQWRLNRLQLAEG
ncbi:Spx/MgsR family RNA polymerase-binding regulatory protein [Oceanobacillus sp. 143]|uniref:Global transcriptional regulator Spx n=1 Tax=Oceanobacillus zhaokaii TaxID=2052660 RepID=A0A345PLH2_9BACI|nr:Spx/MgsR family RNA polymerase-binding regulatory protein [Oceanobacillus zhaokaii]AXI10852.1 transcriptional regulator Spx [Oceanobacillus zhaokaii]QGS69729.1 Spx/MgsR family RNA polymerase-binding regulatory protein [Oceanobacillus sp. 143]